MCGYIESTQQDVQAWNKLTPNGSSKAVLKVGLFGNDMSCITAFCAETANDSNNFCQMVQAKGIDGWAFGAYFNTANGNTNYYCAGFHNKQYSDNMVCNMLGPIKITNYWFAQDYTVTSTFPTVGTNYQKYPKSQSTEYDYYGFGNYQFTYQQHSYAKGVGPNKGNYWNAFRFIGQNENGGKRWSVGDTIDLFYTTWMASSGKGTADNLNFVLQGATTTTTLTAVGVALLTAAVM